MYSEKELFQEVKDIINALDDNAPAIPSWITNAIMSEHSNIVGNDADFHFCCSRGFVLVTVRKALNQYKLEPTATPDPQLLLPGFKRVQKRYLVERDGEHPAIPVGQLTVEEINAKIEELERMAVGCAEHARELRRFRDTRLVA